MNRQPIMEHAEEAMRRISNCSSKFDSADSILGELDLRQDYDNAINCLIQCETIIKNLQDQLTKKEEQLAEAEAKYEKPQEELSFKTTMQVMQEEMASKDDRIANLEEKLVQMSLELASTKAHEDELQHQLNIAKSVPPSFDNNNMSCSNSNYKPCSKNRRHTTTSALRGQQRSSWRSTDDATMEVTHGSKMSLSSIVSNTVTPSTPLDESNNTSSTSRLSSFGQFFTKTRSSRGEMQVMFPSQLGLGEEKKVESAVMNSVNETSTQLARPRRQPNTSRMMLGKSSRSFLETKGVVFPVSSFEVLSKGCLPPSLSKSGLLNNINGSKGGVNEEWDVFK